MTCSNLNAASGVAPVNPSVAGFVNGKVNVAAEKVVKRSGKKAGYQVVMATGNAACSTARPTKAGLNTLHPKPPKANLPSAIEITPPKNAIHNGKFGGSVSPNNKPVITADQSDMVLSFWLILQSTCSVSTAEKVVVISSIKALKPNE